MASTPTISGDNPCEVHGSHAPLPYGTDLHHVWPRGMGGPDVAENRVAVCATGHQNIHAVLRLLIKHGGAVPKDDLKGFARAEIKFATLGYERDLRGSL